MMTQYHDYVSRRDKFLTEDMDNQEMPVMPAPSDERGTEQNDPDNPDKLQALITALEEIVTVGRRALETHKRALGSSKGNEDKSEAEPDDKPLVTRPSADNVDSMFGGD